MKLKLISLCLLTALVLSLFAGCGETRPLTEEKAYEIVYAHAGVTAEDTIDPHLHVIAENGVPMYNIHFSVGSTEYDYNIHAHTGEILTHKP